MNMTIMRLSATHYFNWVGTMRKFCSVSLLVAAASFGAQSVYATTIDFESFVAGDDLTTVNAATAPLGATFGAAFPGLFQIIVDPNDASNNIASSVTFPPEFDLIVNFSAPLDFVQIEFVDNPERIDISVFMAVFDVPITTLDMIPEVDFVSGTEPNVFSSSFEGIRSIALESASSQILIDNLTFRFARTVPEPTTLALFGLGLAGLGLTRRKVKQTQILAA